MKKLLLLLICLLGISSALLIVQKDRIPRGEIDNGSFNNKNEIQAIDVSTPIEIDTVTEKLSLYDSKWVKFTISLSFIPTYEAHLNGQCDQLIEIKRKSSEFLNLKDSDGSSYLIIKYNCGVKSCSSLLVKQSNDKNVFESIELGYGVLMDMRQSPNAENVVFRYGVNEGDSFIRDNLVLVDLTKMDK